MAIIQLTEHIGVDDEEFVERFVRASGPGGQNVNKVSTAVELRFDVSANISLPSPVRARLRRLAGRRLTKEGVIVLQAMKFRTQELNRTDARERLIALLRQATIAPKPRIKTRPTRASKERRLKSKTLRGRTKSGRGKPSLD